MNFFYLKMILIDPFHQMLYQLIFQILYIFKQIIILISASLDLHNVIPLLHIHKMQKNLIILKPMEYYHLQLFEVQLFFIIILNQDIQLYIQLQNIQYMDMEFNPIFLMDILIMNNLENIIVLYVLFRLFEILHV